MSEATEIVTRINSERDRATERLVVHIAHENDDGTLPTHFLCGVAIRVLLPGERYAGDPEKSECPECNRIDAVYSGPSSDKESS